MAAASTLCTRSGRGKSSDTMTLEQLQARIAELEKSVPQRPVVAKKLPTGKPFMFDGTRDDQKIFTWLSRIKTQHKVSAIASGTTLTEEEKIIVAISYLDDIPCRLYDSKQHMIHSIQICQIFANLKLQITSSISSNQIEKKLNLIKSNE